MPRPAPFWPSALILALLMLAGCDAHVCYRFQVVNSMAQAVDIGYQVDGRDSTVHVPAGARAQLHEQFQVNSGVKPYFTSDTIWWFTHIGILRADSVAYQGEPRLVAHWNFIPSDTGVGIYELILRDADFR